jgi:hypothetical protein
MLEIKKKIDERKTVIARRKVMEICEVGICICTVKSVTQDR